MKKTIFAMLAMVAAFAARAAQIELLTNGDGSTLSGWQNSSTDPNGNSAFTASADNDGVSWFKSCRWACRLYQRRPVTDNSWITINYIQQECPAVTVSGIVTAGWGSKICKVMVYEYDLAGNDLARHVILDRSGEEIKGEAEFSSVFNINPNTYQLEYELQGQDSKFWNGEYGPWFRNCSMTIFCPVNVNFVSDGVSLGTFDYETPPVAPKKADYRFLGYFTDEIDGDQIIDENYEFVAAPALTPVEGATLYAHWAPVIDMKGGDIAKMVYRGLLSNFGEWTSGLTKNMTVKVYDSASAAEPLWSGVVENVPINPDGSFETVFGNEDLAYAFASNNITHVELTVGDALSPLAPRRQLASVASVNRALVAEGAASDVKVGTLGANAIIAEKVTAGSMEALGTVRVEGSVSVEVKPFAIERGSETTIFRGEGVSAWGDAVRVATTNDVVAGQLLWTADREGVAVIHCSGKSRSSLRIPATVQFVRPDDEVRAPTFDAGEVSVTVWSYKK